MKNNTKTICIVSPFPPPYGGMAIQAQKLAFLLREIGFDVVTVRTNADLPAALNFISKIKGIRTILSIFIFLRNLHKTLPRVDVVYFLTGFLIFFWVTYPALLLIKLHGKRIILSARGGGAKKFFQRYGILVKPILKQVDIITTPSGFLRDVFKETLNIETSVVPNIVDLEQLKFRKRLPVQPRILTTRSLEKIYNTECVIKAFKIIHEHFPESELGIAGDGSRRTVLEQLVTALGLNDSITFYGVVDHEKIPEIYDQYDIYVNVSSVDNLPGVILEAYASGLPVVSTNAGGIPYMVEDGATGLLVDLDDHNDLAAKVIHLIENPEFALTLAKNGRNECRKYSWEHIKTVLLPIL
jgi:Glycosyltransferase